MFLKAIVYPISGNSFWIIYNFWIYDTVVINRFQPTNLSFDTSQNNCFKLRRIFLSSKRSTRTIDTQPLVTNLTAGNFIGFSDAAYTNGQTATIQIEGSVDDAQTGLTTAKVHYISPINGTLSTTAGTPSVSAGIAITDTKIIVKG